MFQTAQIVSEWYTVDALYICSSFCLFVSLLFLLASPPPHYFLLIFSVHVVTFGYFSPQLQLSVGGSPKMTEE